MAPSLATPFSCAVILVVGIPHGTLDIELLKSQQRLGRGALIAAVLLYLGLAAAMYAVWQSAPILALILFLLMSILHFAEDWDDVLPSFMAIGSAVAILSAPALLHRGALIVIFAQLTAAEPARLAILVDVIRAVAPLAILTSICGVVWLWSEGQRTRAATGITALFAMLLTPPLIGFGLFFCALHSPMQLSKSLTTSNFNGIRGASRIIIPVTAAAFGIAVMIGASGALGSLNQTALTACFITLSILTVPHMAVPGLVSRIRGAQRAYSFRAP